MPVKSNRKLTGRERRDLDIEIGFMERLVQRDPAYIEALQILGADYTRSGNIQAGLKIDRKLARLLPADPTVLYNLACSYSLAHKVKQAATTLRKALDLGFSDYKVLLRDPDLENLRQDPVFERIKHRIFSSRRHRQRP